MPPILFLAEDKDHPLESPAKYLPSFLLPKKCFLISSSEYFVSENIRIFSRSFSLSLCITKPSLAVTIQVTFTANNFSILNPFSYSKMSEFSFFTKNIYGFSGFNSENEIDFIEFSTKKSYFKSLFPYRS